MIFANESPKIGAIFVPALGNAPKFCHFIENLTEEMEETINQQIFNDFQFVTHEQLTSMNALHLLKEGKAVPHMHGYLVQQKMLSFLKGVKCFFLINRPNGGI
jgi:ribosome biogenesis protein ENP2